MSERPIWKNYHIVTLVIATVTCMFLGSLVGMAVSRIGLGYEAKSAGDQFMLQLGGTLLGMQVGGLVSIHFFLKAHGTNWRDGFGFAFPLRAALVGLLACAVFLPLAWGLQMAMRVVLERFAVAPELQQTVVTMQAATTPLWQQLVLGIVAVVFAPLIEELLFRGVLYRWIHDQGRPALALWGTALLFGLIHFNTLAFVPLTLFGALLAWLYQRSGNLLLPIFTHASFNLLNLLAIVYREPIGRFFERLS